MSEIDPLFEVAKQVSEAAGALGIRTAVIGALAMAHHGYVRATLDLDLASAVPLGRLRALAERLRGQGLLADLRLPDGDDPLNGVLRVRSAPDEPPVDIVNFHSDSGLAVRTVERAELGEDGLAYARVPEIVALKLYAGSRFDRDDAARLLAEVGDVDAAALREASAAGGVQAELDRLLAELANTARRA